MLLAGAESIRYWDNRAVSPKSRGRPPGRGRSRKVGRRAASGRRLAGLGYDWHNVMHMIMGPVSAFLHQAMTGKVPFRREEFIRQLNELLGDCPPPEETGG